MPNSNILTYPNGIIRVLQGVPLDNSYKNTIWFDKPETQEAYFQTKIKPHPNGGVWEFTEQTYTRFDNQNKVRVQGNELNFVDCNYLMFQNMNFGGRWFYAFITGVTYINNVTSDIYYEIDVMQSWMFQVNLSWCFVEREHTLTDKLGEYILDEPVGGGEMICVKEEKVAEVEGIDLDEWGVVLAHTTAGSTDLLLERLGGIITGCHYEGYENTNEGLETLKNLLQAITDANQIDSVINLFAFPIDLLNWAKSHQSTPFTGTYVSTKPTGFSNYLPHNNKLYTRNYCNVTVLGDPSSATYYYEEYNTPDDTNLLFEFTANVSAMPEMALCPMNYDRRPQDYNNRVVMTDFPNLPFAIDSYKRIVATGYQTMMEINHSASMIGNGISTVLGGAQLASGLMGVTGAVGGAMAGVEIPSSATRAPNSIRPQGLTPELQSDLVGGASKATGGGATMANGMLAIGTEMASYKIAQMNLNSVPNQWSGAKVPLLSLALKRKGFYIRHNQIRLEYAKMVDTFFDMYGYQVNQLKIPNIVDHEALWAARKHFYFVKLGLVNYEYNWSQVQAERKTCVPVTELAKITQIYQNGITFWKNPEEVGDYSVVGDNTAPK